MKYFIYILIAIAVGLIGFNATKLNFESLLIGDSKTAVFSIIASACVVVLLIILLISMAIQQKSRSRK